MVKVGINGFGRIGRQVLRLAVENDDVKVVAVNDLWDTETFVNLLRRDSNFGPFPVDVEECDGGLLVDGEKIEFFSQRDPADIPWSDVGVQVVVESTGLFRDGEQAEKHITGGGAEKVLISAPATDMDLTVVLGVNDAKYNPDNHSIISNASCTTNCLAPLSMVLDENFGIKNGVMNTIHAYTSNQQLLDGPHKDPRRARAAAVNMIPTTTGAARAVGEVLPHLDGKLDGFAVRVPTTTVSLLDLTVQVEKQVTIKDINEAMEEEAEGRLSGIMGVCDEPLVSGDFVGSPYSCVVDREFTHVVGDQMAKVVAWYDNEMGYAARLVDVISQVIGPEL